MDSNVSAAPATSGLRRFSFSSIRSNLSSAGGHSSQDGHPDSASTSTTAAHRTLQQQTRGSRPPTSGPAVSRHLRSKASMDSQGSGGSYFSRNTPSTVLHSVKRSLSITRKSSHQEKPLNVSYGMTAEENVYNLSALPTQQPLRAPPTFQQIASGVAVRSNRPREQKSEPPRKPSLKQSKTSLTPPTTQVPSAFPKLRRFSSSSPSPGFPQHASLISSSSSTSTSSSSSNPHPSVIPKTAKHKLSLGISTFTGRGRETPSTGSTVSSIDAGGRKAVRFTDSPEPGSVLSLESASDDVIAVVDAKAKANSGPPSTYAVTLPKGSRSSVVPHGTFVEKATARLFTR